MDDSVAGGFRKEHFLGRDQPRVVHGTSRSQMRRKESAKNDHLQSS